jgi:hypothetical protein
VQQEAVWTASANTGGKTILRLEEARTGAYVVAQQEYLWALHTGVSNRVLLAATTLHKINLIPSGN